MKKMEKKEKEMEQEEEVDDRTMPVFEQECSYDNENALLICNIKPILFNFRDLASASSSKRLQAGLLWRSAAACRGFPDISISDVPKILTWWVKEARIRTIVDLRSRGEKRADPFDLLVERAFPTVLDSGVIGTTRRKRFSCNLMNTRMMIEGLVLPSPNEVKKKVLRSFLQPEPAAKGSRTKAAMTTFVKEVMNPGGLTRYSILLLIFSQPTLLKILRICSDTRNHPVMFHCSSGKDRTALILAVCGLSDEEIFDDYEKSQTYLAPCMHLIQVEDRSKGLDPEFDGTPRYVIKRTFKWLRKIWGSVERYLNYIGFTYSEQRKLSEVMRLGNKRLKSREREEQLLRQQYLLSPHGLPRRSDAAALRRQARPKRGELTRSQSLPKLFDSLGKSESEEDEQSATSEEEAATTPRPLVEVVQAADASSNARRFKTPYPRMPSPQVRPEGRRSEDIQRRHTYALPTMPQPPYDDNAHQRYRITTVGREGPVFLGDDEDMPPRYLPGEFAFGDTEGERKKIAELLTTTMLSEAAPGAGASGRDRGEVAAEEASEARSPIPDADPELQLLRQEREQRVLDLKTRFHLHPPAPLIHVDGSTESGSESGDTSQRQTPRGSHLEDSDTSSSTSLPSSLTPSPFTSPPSIRLSASSTPALAPSSAMSRQSSRS